MSYAPMGSELALIDGELTRPPGPDFSPPSASLRTKSTRPGKHLKQLPRAAENSESTWPVIVHSHLCWDWVWQRPQQFVSRLSAARRVLFIETVQPDPQLSSTHARFRTLESFPNLTVLRVQLPAWRWADGAFVDRERRRVVLEFLDGPGAGRFDNPVQWFYDPMAVRAFAGHLGEIGIVYDCMDELSRFRFAPEELSAREAELLAKADVVFTGGRKLCDAKKRHNRNCHFYGCGVDFRHFSRAREACTAVPEDLAGLSRPVLGYFGVVDERIDYELLSRLADDNRDGSVVVIGPALKVEPSEFPRRPNLHWFGQRPYAQLPEYCKGFDVCLMPFALNESTEFINPTKTLEYMAAGRPIVSTALPDVISNFSGIVAIARSHEEFLSLCRRGIQHPDRQALQRGLEMASTNSWESIVDRLEQHVEETLRNLAGARAVPAKTGGHLHE